MKFTLDLDGNFDDKIKKISSSISGLIPQMAAFEIASKAAAKAVDAIKFVAGAAELRGNIERSFEVLYGSQKGAEHTFALVSQIADKVATSQSDLFASASALERAGMRNGNMMVKAVETVATAEAAREGAGKAIQGILERSAQSRYFSVSRDEVLKMGVTYKDLATAISKNTGVGVGEATQSLIAGRVSMRAGLDALSSMVETKMGAIAKKKFMTLGVQTQRLQDNFARLFDGVKTGPFVDALSKVADMLSGSSKTGAMLKSILELAFEKFGNAVMTVLPYAEIAFYSVATAALMFYNRVLTPLASELGSMFGTGGVENFEAVAVKALEGFASALDTTVAAVKSARAVIGDVFAWVSDNAVPLAITAVIAFKGTLISAAIAGGSALATMAAGAVAAFVPVATAVLAATWPIVAIGAAVFGVYKAFQILKPMVMEIFDFDWGAHASAIVDGLIGGVVEKFGAIKDTFKKLANGAIDAFKSTFGIASPAKVMIRAGRDVVKGAQVGIEKEQPALERTSAGMLDPPTTAASVAAGQAAGGATSNNVHMPQGSIIVNISGVQGAQDLADRFPALFADAFEKLGLSMGVSA